MRTKDPFHLSVPPEAPLHHRAALAAARPLLSSILGLAIFRQLYEQTHGVRKPRFSARALHVLNVTADVARRESDVIPAEGPLIIAANHPHGALDGLVLAEVVAARRTDVRVLANRLLARIPELADLCLYVDPFEGKDRAVHSRAGLRAALEWLRNGHALIVFPAGEVAHVRSTSTPRDSMWHTTVGRLALGAGAPVVPAFIEGRNSRSFYLAGHVHPSLRTVLLPRELLNQRGRRVPVRLGRPVPPAVLSTYADDPAGATACLRDAVDALGQDDRRPAPAHVPVRSPVDPLALEMDVRALREEHKLIAGGALDVFYAPAPHIPAVLQEIGRLREVTFRAVGEGTGRSADLDRFDEHYGHLFVWNNERREIAGAYRIGATDAIVAEHGIAGLYTSTLFQYDERLLTHLTPALELGRSFVRAEYQRSSNALLLLWKGIGRLVTRSGRYRVLFGPVSISSQYGDRSQQILKAFLADNHYDQELGNLVRGIAPPADTLLPVGVAAQTVSDIGDVDRMIARLEQDGRGMPVLLRQYLRLNAKLLGFNVDPAFGDALDALMMVDLANVDPAILRRYLGREETARFLRRHSPAAA